MKRLAGVETEIANKVVRAELEEAGINLAPFNPGDSEVRATIGGVIDAGGYRIELDRRWAYWGAKISGGRALPRSLAIELNEAPFNSSEHSRYSGDEPRLGSVVRADGYAGGHASKEIGNWVRLWHIDTQEGLNTFAKWCKENLK